VVRTLDRGVDDAIATAALALLVEQVIVERRGLELGLLLGGGDLAQQAVDRVDDVGRRLVAVALRQRRQLQQLQIAGDRPVDVDRGVEAQLGELASRSPGDRPCLRRRRLVRRLVRRLPRSLP